MSFSIHNLFLYVYFHHFHYHCFILSALLCLQNFLSNICFDMQMSMTMQWKLVYDITKPLLASITVGTFSLKELVSLVEILQFCWDPSTKSFSGHVIFSCDTGTWRKYSLEKQASPSGILCDFISTLVMLSAPFYDPFYAEPTLQWWLTNN